MRRCAIELLGLLASKSSRYLAVRCLTPFTTTEQDESPSSLLLGRFLGRALLQLLRGSCQQFGVQSRHSCFSIDEPRSNLGDLRSQHFGFQYGFKASTKGGNE